MNKRLNYLGTTLLSAGLILGVSNALAQEPGNAPETTAPSAAEGPGGGHRGMMDPDQQLARMTKRYNLSADQQGQIKPILMSQQQQMQAMHGDSSMSREDRMTKMQGIRSDSTTKIEAILNDDQKKKFEQDQQRMQQRRESRGGQGGDAGGPPPPQQ